MKFSTLLLGGILGGLSSSIYIMMRYEIPLEKELKNRDEQLEKSLKQTRDVIACANFWKRMYETLQNSLRKDETK